MTIFKAKKLLLLLSINIMFLSSGSADAADAPAKKSGKKAPAAPAATPGSIKVNTSGPADDVVTGSSTRIDFSETNIDGKMKAPDGFFLQGHNSNSLSQLVQLRSNFRSELRNSSSAVKSHVK